MLSAHQASRHAITRVHVRHGHAAAAAGGGRRRQAAAGGGRWWQAAGGRRQAVATTWPWNTRVRLGGGIGVLGVLGVELRASGSSASACLLDEADRVSESSASPLAVGTVGRAVTGAPCNARRSVATGCSAVATLAEEEGEEGRGGGDRSIRCRCAARFAVGLVSRCAAAWSCCAWACGLTGVDGCARLVEGC